MRLPRNSCISGDPMTRDMVKRDRDSEATRLFLGSHQEWRITKYVGFAYLKEYYYHF